MSASHQTNKMATRVHLNNNKKKSHKKKQKQKQKKKATPGHPHWLGWPGHPIPFLFLFFIF
jgi:hypothetical protein